jgi:hypothetical protein
MNNYLLIALIFSCSFECKSASGNHDIQDNLIVDLPLGETQTEPLITTFSDESPLAVITSWQHFLTNASQAPMILFSSQYCAACCKCLSGKRVHQSTGIPAGKRNLKLKDFGKTKESLIKEFGAHSFEVKIYTTIETIKPATKDQKITLLKMLSAIHSRKWQHTSQTVDQAAAIMVLAAK